jgi:hypothetical protein
MPASAATTSSGRTTRRAFPSAVTAPASGGPGIASSRTTRFTITTACSRAPVSSSCNIPRFQTPSPTTSLSPIRRTFSSVIISRKTPTIPWIGIFISRPAAPNDSAWMWENENYTSWAAWLSGTTNDSAFDFRRPAVHQREQHEFSPLPFFAGSQCGRSQLSIFDQHGRRNGHRPSTTYCRRTHRHRRG